MIVVTCIVASIIAGTSLGSSIPLSAAPNLHHSVVTESTVGYGHRINGTKGPKEGQDITFDNWSGALLTTTGVTGVTGTFVVPDPRPPANADPSVQYCGTAWVGIDGDSSVCPGVALMQAGVQWCVGQDKIPTFYAWQEWVPEEPSEVPFEGFEVTAGHKIRVTVNATDPRNGNALVENLSTGDSRTHIWTAEETALCERTAEWIVEDATAGGVSGTSLQPFADYRTVVFTDNYAFVEGQEVGISYAVPVDIYQNEELVSKGSISDGKVIATYQG